MYFRIVSYCSGNRQHCRTYLSGPKLIKPRLNMCCCAFICLRPTGRGRLLASAKVAKSKSFHFCLVIKKK